MVHIAKTASSEITAFFATVFIPTRFSIDFLLPFISSSLHSTYAELIALAGEVEEILSRKALLQTLLLLKMNHIEANGSMKTDIEREFDGLTIDELTSCSHIESDPQQEEHPDSLTYAPVIRWMKSEPRVENTSVYSIHANTNFSTKPKANEFKNGLRGNPNNLKGDAAPDTPSSRHAAQPDHPQGVRPRPQEDWGRGQQFHRNQAREVSSSRPWMLRRTSGHQSPSDNFQSNDLRRQARKALSMTRFVTPHQ